MSFADLELLRQGVRLEPLLQAICDFLDQQPALIERVRRDLMRGLKEPDKGRRGLTAPQVLRALVLMRVKNWDYRELRERIADGITLRQFTDFYCETVPKHDAFNRSFNRLTPATLRAVNDLIVEAAVKLGLEDGSKLRVDTTVVETNIHHPTDNTLLWDVVRVLTRLLGRLAKALELRRIAGFRDRSRAAHRRMYEIQRMTTRQRQGAGSRQTATCMGKWHIGELQGRWPTDHGFDEWYGPPRTWDESLWPDDPWYDPRRDGVSNMMEGRKGGNPRSVR